jgi:outer membrane protein TolC
VITWPLLNLGRVKAGVDVSRARRDEAEARYQLAVLQAQQEIASAVIRYRSAQARVVQIEAAAVASERAAELARLRFSEGAADFLQVLDAERTQLEAQDQLARARTDAASAYAGLYRAVGR